MSSLLEQLRSAVKQQEFMLSNELPDDAPASTVFDLAFSGHIRGLMEELEQGRIDIPDWERRTRDIEQWMNNDPMVRAFEEEATKAGRVPLASRTFLNLAQRQVRRKANPRKANQGIPDSQRLPDFSEGCAVARVMLASTRTKDRWERDLHPNEISQQIAEHWLSRRGIDDLLCLLPGSEQITICWDALALIWDVVGDSRVLEDRREFVKHLGDIPLPLLLWRTEAAQGLRRRPPEPAPPPYRPTKLGYIIRDIRIKSTIRVLEQLGMPPTGGPDSGCSVVAAVLEAKPPLDEVPAKEMDERIVREVWRRPDAAINESYTKCIDRQFV